MNREDMNREDINREDIIRMAQEIAAEYSKAERFQTWTHDYMMQRLMELVATEREACAKLCETIGNTQANMNETWRNGCRDAATEIRARGQA